MPAREPEAAMTDHEISRDEAARALAEVSERRRQVAGVAAPVPAWYPPVTGVLVGVWLGLLESRSSAIMVGGSAVIVLQGLLIWWTRRHQPVKPHASLYGVRGWLAVAGTVAALWVVSMVVLSFVHSHGVPLPAVVYGTTMGVIITVTFALLRLGLRRIFVRRAAEVRP
jgi:hypothetical protein